MVKIRAFDPSSIEQPHGLSGFAWPSTFKDGAPWDLEIGCGVGWHPIQYAKANKDRRLIAIEHTREKFEKFAGRVDRHPELSNILPVHADAMRWVTHAIPAESVDRVFLLYPNPEPKASNKRWLRMPFFQRLLEIMKPGATLTLATNIESYFQEALEYGQKAWGLELVETRSFKLEDELPGLPRTHFEKKYLVRGETCFDVTFRKARATLRP
ncbi:MAG: SAM-dependent methyltransferase [Proteobacteria bacterium]|nr:MAG: SAM-dependent methyltransferase [Pseudomonadota bacterium]